MHREGTAERMVELRDGPLQGKTRIIVAWDVASPDGDATVEFGYGNDGKLYILNYILNSYHRNR